MNLFKLFGTIAINSQEANSALDSVGAKAEGTGGKLSSLAGPAKAVGTAIVAGAAVAGVALAGIGIASVKMAADFDKGMREVNTLVGGSEEELDKMKQQVLDLSKEMGVASGEAVPALYNAISAGVPPENAVDFLRVASIAAIGGVTDLDTAVGGLTTALNAFELEADQAEHVADVLFAGVKAGKTTMDELSSSLFQVAPLANAAGVSLEETVAAMSALTLGGTPTSVAATQVRAAIQGILKPTDEMIAVFQEAGYESGQMAIEQLGLAGAMGIIEEAADGDIGALTKLVGSVEATQAILALTGAQAEAYATTLDGMQNDTGVAQAAFDEMNKSASRQFQILKNQLNVAMIELGSKLLPLVTEAGKRLLPVISSAIDAFLSLVDGIAATIRDGQALRENFEGLSPTLQGIAMALANVVLFLKNEFIPAFISGVETVLPILKSLFDFIINNKPVLIAAITAIGVSIALALGPGTLAVAAIIGIIALIGYLRDNWDQLKAKAEQIFPGISKFISDAGKVISDVFKALGEAGAFLVNAIRAHWSEINAVIGFAIDFMVEKIKGGIQFWQGIVQIISGIIALVSALFHGDWAAAWEAMKQIADGILTTLIGLIKYHFGNIPGIIAGLASDAANAAAKFAQGIYDAIVRILQQLPGKMAQLGKDAANAFLNSISVAGISAGDVAGVIGKIPGLAGGGYAEGGLTWVGELGPELMQLPRGARVFSNRESRQMTTGEEVKVFIDKVIASTPAEGERRGHDIAWAIRRRGFAT